MPNIPWAVGEEETFKAAGISGQRRLDAINQWGNIGGQSIALYKLAKQKRQAREDELQAVDEYNRIDGQTADELLKQDEEAAKAQRGHNSPSMITSAADDGLHDPDTGGGDSAPGTDKQDVQTSKQQDGAKPAQVSDPGATTESSPPPATKDEASADEAKTVQGTADRNPTPRALWRVATDGVEAAGKNVGQFVTRTPEMVADAARTAGGKIANLGGGHFWNDVGSIVGIDDPQLGDQRSRLAKFAAQSRMRKEGAERAAHLAPLAAQSSNPGKFARALDPYGMRGMKGLEGIPRADEGDNLNVFGMLLKAEGATTPEAYRNALAKYVKIEGFLESIKARGHDKDSPLEAAQRIMLDPHTSRDEKQRAYEFLEIMRHVGVIKDPAENPFGPMIDRAMRPPGTPAPPPYAPNWERLQGGGGRSAPAPADAGLFGGTSGITSRGEEDYNFAALPADAQKLALDPRWDAASEKHGVPKNLARAIAWQESHYNPGARGLPVPSHGGARAMGMGQFMPSTGAEYGIDEGNFQDVDLQIDRINAKLAKDYQRTGSWEGAVGAYFGGGYDPVSRKSTSEYVPEVLRRFSILNEITAGGGQIVSTPAEPGAAGAATPEISTVNPQGQRTPLGALAATPPPAPTSQLVMPPGLLNAPGGGAPPPRPPQGPPPQASGAASTTAQNPAWYQSGGPLDQAVGLAPPPASAPPGTATTTGNAVGTDSSTTTTPPVQSEAYRRWREEWLRTGQRPTWDYETQTGPPAPVYMTPSGIAPVS